LSEIPPMTPIQQHIFTELAHGKSLTRHDLVIKLNTPRTTIYNNLEKLQNKKLVLKFDRHNGKRGRPKVLWYIPRHMLEKGG